MELVLFIVLSIGVPFALQLLLMHLSRRRFRFLRWLVPLGAIPWVVMAVLGMDSIFWELALLIYLTLAAADLLGWGLGWPVYRLLERRKRNEQKDTSEAD